MYNAQYEEWLVFSLAAEEMSKRCDMSVGVALRMLREACAQGDVRSLGQQWLVKGTQIIEDEQPPELIKPSEWLHEEIDLRTEDGYEYIVSVNKDDFRYWLDRQHPT